MVRRREKDRVMPVVEFLPPAATKGTTQDASGLADGSMSTSGDHVLPRSVPIVETTCFGS